MLNKADYNGFPDLFSVYLKPTDHLLFNFEERRLAPSW